MIKVISKNFTHKNKKSEFILLLKELKNYAINEKNCINYELFQDKENDTIITIISEWKEIAHLDAYYKSPYFIEVIDKISDFLKKESEINIYDIVD